MSLCDGAARLCAAGIAMHRRAVLNSARAAQFCSHRWMCECVRMKAVAASYRVNLPAGDGQKGTREQFCNLVVASKSLGLH